MDISRVRRVGVAYGEPVIRTRTLYHFTKPTCLEQILATGVLEARWSADDSAPKTVHTMDSTAPEDLPWSFREGRTIRFELRIPEADTHHWFVWAKKADHVPANVFRSLGVPVWTPDNPAFVSNQNLGSKHWYVIERQIPVAEWVEIVNIDTGTVIWPSGNR
ncbi:hypothetical protein EHYA_07502 [Embleya hyalina]|uniref:Uncharacterized protein n=2 Tax=Embleya hyalina TaxID=516124 RepID=A0A401YZ02_9ACTN|nr:hypothetical protein EHYA_07502 [Embleya hyalina]